MAAKNVEFRLNNFIYRQIDGVAIGSLVGAVLANIFVGYFESKLFKDVERDLKYVMYADDIFVSYNKITFNINVLFNKISSSHPSLKFTIENEVNDIYRSWMSFCNVRLLP